MREAGSGQTALHAATASGVLTEDSRELEKIRALGMSPRQLWLNHLWSRFRAIQYEARTVEWDGAEAQGMVDREMMASASSIPSGFYASGDNTPLRFRKPSAPYHLFRVIVQKFSDLLFSEARNPRVTCPGDPAKEDFANGLIEAGRLWSVMAEARNYGGACGGVAVAFSFVDGKPVFEVLEPFYCFPKFKRRSTMEIEKIEVRWIYPVEERNDKGKWETVPYWYRRIIDATNDTVWDAVRAPKDKAGGTKEPDWDAPENEPVVSRHNFGLCPVRWIQNTKLQGGDPEGEFDCTGTLEMIEKMDHLLAEGLQGVDANCDPTLTLEGVEDSAIPELKKGSFNAIKLPKGTAKYLELVGGGPKTAMEWVQQLRSWVLEMCQCVLEDAGETGAGGEAVTATEIRKRYSSMHARAGKLREQYGQNGFLPLLEDMIKAARAVGVGQPPQPTQLVEDPTDPNYGQPQQQPGLVVQRVTVPPKVVKQPDGTVQLQQRDLPPDDSGVLLQAVWPEWFDPTPQDAMAATQAASSALQGGVLDLDHAVRYVAPYYKVDDAAVLTEQLKTTKALADQQQQDALVAAMYGGAPGGGGSPGADPGMGGGDPLGGGGAPPDAGLGDIPQ